VFALPIGNRGASGKISCPAFSAPAWNTAQASVLYAPGMSSAGVRCRGQSQDGAQLPAVYIGALVPGVGNPADGMIVVGQPGVPETLTTGPGLVAAPRFGPCMGRIWRWEDGRQGRIRNQLSNLQRAQPLLFRQLPIHATALVYADHLLWNTLHVLEQLRALSFHPT